MVASGESGSHLGNRASENERASPAAFKNSGESGETINGYRNSASKTQSDGVAAANGVAETDPGGNERVSAMTPASVVASRRGIKRRLMKMRKTK